VKAGAHPARSGCSTPCSWRGANSWRLEPFGRSLLPFWIDNSPPYQHGALAFDAELLAGSLVELVDATAQLGLVCRACVSDQCEQCCEFREVPSVPIASAHNRCRACRTRSFLRNGREHLERPTSLLRVACASGHLHRIAPGSQRLPRSTPQ